MGRGVLFKGVPLQGYTRMQQYSMLNPGISYKGLAQSKIGKYLFRKPELEIYDRYMKNLQYHDKREWKGDLTNQQMDTRKTQPKKVFPLPRIASDMLSSHITAEESRLTFQVDEEKKQEIIDQFIEEIMLWPALEAGFSSLFSNGSLFIRFFMGSDGKIHLDNENTKSCWPVFNENGELESVTIRWIYHTDQYDKEKPIYKWAQYVCGKDKDILYDNPRYEPDKTIPPEFKVVETLNHGSGFVQGVWIKNGFTNQSTDGHSCLDGALDWLDDFNYMGSKESNALYYSLFPILVGLGVAKEDFEEYMKKLRAMAGSPAPLETFNMVTTNNKDANLHFLETSNNGLSLTQAYSQHNVQLMEHILGIYLPDKDRALAYAQSGKAMEFLYKPVVQKVKQMRPFIKKGICELLDKIAQKSSEITPELFKASDKKWGPLFSDTVQDISQRVGYTLQAVQAQIISKKTATKHLAADFGIKNVEDELKEIENDNQMMMENEDLQFQNQAQIQAQYQPKPAAGGSGGTKNNQKSSKKSN